MADRTFDVAIIGGGAAGSATAISLVQLGVPSVCIIEKSDFVSLRAGETIPPDTNLLLSELGADQAFARQGHLPCYGSHSLWGSPQLGHNDYLTSPYGHGWHIDRVRFDAMLLDQAVACGVVHIKGTCTDVNVRGDRIGSVVAAEDRIKAGTFVDATGRNAVLLRSMGIVPEYNDQQTVVWAQFSQTDASMGKSTWLEAAPNGWWYAAALPGNRSVVALGTDPRLAKAGGMYNLRQWAAALTGTTLVAPKLQNARLLTDSFHITASHSYCATRVAGENWIAVGDAACGFDPLSSAGIYKALKSGQSAARAITKTDTRTYATQTRADYGGYLEKRNELYQAEKRWAHSSFWAKRHAVQMA